MDSYICFCVKSKHFNCRIRKMHNLIKLLIKAIFHLEFWISHYNENYENNKYGQISRSVMLIICIKYRSFIFSSYICVFVNVNNTFICIYTFIVELLSLALLFLVVSTNYFNVFMACNENNFRRFLLKSYHLYFHKLNNCRNMVRERNKPFPNSVKFHCY